MIKRISYISKLIFCLIVAINSSNISAGGWKLAGLVFSPLSHALIYYNSCNFHKKINSQLTKEFEEKIREILKEYGLNNWQSLPLRNLTPQVSTLLNITSPAASQPTCILVNEQVCSKYSDQELKFLIGHEAAHIENNHIGKALIAGCLGSLTAIGLTHLATKKYNDIYANPLSRWGQTGIYLAISTLSNIACQKLSRTYETQADLQAAKKLGCYKGALKFFNKSKEVYSYPENGLMKYFLTHPSYEDRAKSIKDLTKRDTTEKCINNMLKANNNIVIYLK